MKIFMGMSSNSKDSHLVTFIAIKISLETSAVADSQDFLTTIFVNSVGLNDCYQ